MTRRAVKAQPVRSAETLWCVFWPEGDPIIMTISHLRKEAIIGWLGEFNHMSQLEKTKWRYWHYRGYRVGKCKVIPV